MRYYYLKDYQGNNCVVLNQNGVVQQINHYYPYGSLMGEVTKNHRIIYFFRVILIFGNEYLLSISTRLYYEF